MKIEDISRVIEHSIRCVDKAELTVYEKRHAIFNLYKIQASLDNLYLHLVPKDILLKNNYLLILPIEQHPDYFIKRDDINNDIKINGCVWLSNDCYAEQDKNGENVFYVEAGSNTWEKLVSMRIINGEDAEHPEEKDIFSTIRQIVVLCRKQFNVYCAAQWYSVIVNFILNRVKRSEEEEKLKEIAYIIFQDAVFNEVSKDSNLSYKINTFKENEPQSTLVKNWVAPFFKWQDMQTQDPNTIVFQARDLLLSREYDKVVETAQRGLSAFPDYAFLQLYEALGSILLLSAQESPNRKQVYFWIDKLYPLCSVKAESEPDSKTIQDHSFYYIAMAYIIAREYGKARKIIKMLKNIRNMEVAGELSTWLQSLIDYGIGGRLNCQET